MDVITQIAAQSLCHGAKLSPLSMDAIGIDLVKDDMNGYLAYPADNIQGGTLRQHFPCWVIRGAYDEHLNTRLLSPRVNPGAV